MRRALFVTVSLLLFVLSGMSAYVQIVHPDAPRSPVGYHCIDLVIFTAMACWALVEMFRWQKDWAEALRAEDEAR